MSGSVSVTPGAVFQGMSIAVLGPTFQNLAQNVRRNVSDIYFVFVGRSLGYLGGSVLGGLLFDCLNAHLLLGETRGCGVRGEGVGGPRGAELGLRLPLAAEGPSAHPSLPAAARRARGEPGALVPRG